MLFVSCTHTKKKGGEEKKGVCTGGAPAARAAAAVAAGVEYEFVAAAELEEAEDAMCVRDVEFVDLAGGGEGLRSSKSIVSLMSASFSVQSRADSVASAATCE